MAKVILFNKPFNVLCQFTDTAGRAALADYIPVRRVYAAGRLDYDSEGLVVLTDDGRWQQRISEPRYKLPKTYWAQVEGVPDAAALDTLARGVALTDGKTAPAAVRAIAPPPDLWERTPPIRYRARIPTSWLELTITEGRNRQVRHMTAAVGHPTLRLIRWAVGPWTLAELKPGAWRELEIEARPARNNRRGSGRGPAQRRKDGVE